MVVGITGSIGSINLVNYLGMLEQYFEIRLILTENATKFINPRGFESIVIDYYVDMFTDGKVLHTDMAYSADELLLLPASANTISKMSHGIADNLLTSTLLVYNKPVYIAANMNPDMWNNVIFQDNVEYLKSKGHIFINEGGMAIRSHDKKEVYCEACIPSPKKVLNYLIK